MIPEWVSKYWVEWIFGIIATALLAGYKRLSSQIKAEKAKQSAMQNGICALLRDRIIQAYNYYNDKGYCPIYARENIYDMYEAYNALVGDENGTVAQLKTKIDKMPMEPKKGDNPS